ncbi:MAG: signal recognition particle-docking protein FtsY [Aggregatilineales bacterium]
MSIFKRGMNKTRRGVFGRLTTMLGSVDEIDDDLWDDLEATLIQADLGIETTNTVLEFLQETVRSDNIRRTDKLRELLEGSLSALIEDPTEMNITGRDLSIILIVGVNGAGKTTSIAKLAHHLKTSGRQVILAAGDTFRAAAIDQLQRWGERIDIPVIANKPGADPGAVVYDAIAAAKARNKDVLIVDTAGRLHNNYNLMQELAKIKGVIDKAVPGAPHEVLLVLDGTTGQNALRQAVKFAEATEVTGLIITKLDGTSKGGMIFSVHTELNVPIQYIGLGEGVEDMVRFDPENFIDSLFDE